MVNFLFIYTLFNILFLYNNFRAFYVIQKKDIIKKRKQILVNNAKDESFSTFKVVNGPYRSMQLIDKTRMTTSICSEDKKNCRWKNRQHEL